MRKILFFLFSLILFFSLLLFAKAVKWEDIIGAAILLSKDEIAEKLIGKIGSERFEEEFGISEDPEDNARVLNIVSRLLPYLKRKDYKFKVTQNNEVNACAIPGGYIYINKGLLRCPGLQEDELAFVIAHEMTHIEKKHGLKQLKEKLPLVILAKEISSEDAQKIASLVLNIYFAGRSRDDERGADKGAFELLTKAGFHAGGGLSFMRRLECESKKTPDPFERLLATHPPTKERSEYLKDMYLIETTGITYKEASAGQKVRVIGEYKGVPAYSNEKNTGTGEGPWQCVEYVKRFYAEVYGINLGPVGTALRAFEIWGKREDFEKYENGSSHFPTPDDILCFSGGNFGHVAIVTELGEEEIEIIEQNFSKDKARARIKVKIENGGYFISPRGRKGEYKVIGWLHYKGAPPSPLKKPEKEILLEKGPVYLGDEKSGLNTLWHKEFILQNEIEYFKKAKIKFQVRGIPRKDPIVSINRKEIGRAITKSGEWEWWEFPFEILLLQKGNNLVDLETFIPEIRASYDDCEVRDISLNFE